MLIDNMKILVVLALVTVAVSLTEGKVVTKCELREILTNATALQVKPEHQHYMTTEDFVAKIVCHVRKTSGFDTSFVKKVNIDEDGKLVSRRRKRGANQEAEWTLYGLFQLSDHLICKPQPDPDSSVNLCEMSCDDLINDDINDDIDCLEMIKTKLENGSVHMEAVFKMAKLLFEMDCFHVVASEYFKDC